MKKKSGKNLSEKSSPEEWFCLKKFKFAAFLCKRGIAQPGSARRSGRRSRRFKSGYPDQRISLVQKCRAFFYLQKFRNGVVL